ncbi:MAG: polymer-forming cytoskeletal protein [Candidatus Aminicenantaceae bacterium]
MFASEKVHIEKNGHMNGDIIASRISIDDGAHFKGSVKINASNTSSS